MMNDYLFDAIIEILDAGVGDRAHVRLAESGYLDLLVPESMGGAGMALEEIAPFVLRLGGHIEGEPVLREIVARGIASAMDQAAAAAAGPGTRRKGELLAAAVDAALMVGAARQVLDMSVEYAGARTQFGKAVGRFQAVQGLLAEMAEHVRRAESAVYAAWRGDITALDEIDICTARICAGEASELVAAHAHAVHGAIGISADYILHRYSANLARWRGRLGGNARWAARLGELCLDGGSPILEFLVRRS